MQLRNWFRRNKTNKNQEVGTTFTDQENDFLVKHRYIFASQKLENAFTKEGTKIPDTARYLYDKEQKHILIYSSLKSVVTYQRSIYKLLYKIVKIYSCMADTQTSVNFSKLSNAGAKAIIECKNKNHIKSFDDFGKNKFGILEIIVRKNDNEFETLKSPTHNDIYMALSEIGLDKLKKIKTKNVAEALQTHTPMVDLTKLK